MAGVADDERRIERSVYRLTYHADVVAFKMTCGDITMICETVH